MGGENNRPDLKPDVADELRNRGLRVTPQRALILGLIKSASGHITAEDIYREVNRRLPFTDISTVYRTLDLLEAHGLVRRLVTGQGQTQYEWADQPHFHLICTGCGRVSNFVDDDLTAVIGQVAAQHGYRLTEFSVNVFGLCPDCQQEGEDAHP